jgi:hypothetical protein
VQNLPTQFSYGTLDQTIKQTPPPTPAPAGTSPQ